MGINPYLAVGGYTVVFDHGKIKIVTKEKVDIREGVIMLPKSLILFILNNDLPTPLKISVLTPSEEVGGLVDAICFSPDEKSGFLTLKGLYYLSK